MKLLWDAVGSEFGARHELYEMNYAGSHELVRLYPLHLATWSGELKQMEAFAERCMADYDENGWKDPAYADGRDISRVHNYYALLARIENANNKLAQISNSSTLSLVSRKTQCE